MQPVFREATIDDLPAIIDLLADDGLGRGRESPGLPLHPNYLRAFETIRSDPNQLLAVADRGGIVGCLQISFSPGRSRLGMLRGQIEDVRIAAAARGGGLGCRMIEWAIEACRRRGCGLVHPTSDTSQTGAARFYVALGFVPSHTGFKLSLD